MSCTIKYQAPKKNSQLATKNFLVAKTIIDKFNNILDFTKWSNEAGRLNNIAKRDYQIKEDILSSEQQGKVAYFNQPMFDEIDRQKGDFTKYQSNNDSGIIASEKTIRDLAARMSDRIGIPVQFESDRSLNYRGKIENGRAIINLAYATLDTPIHEILGHPIIRAIKNGSKFQIEENLTEKDADKIIEKNHVIEKNGIRYLAAYNAPDGTVIYRYDKIIQTKPNTELYQNLLKELEYGKGKEVLDRIKRDYVYKHKEPTQQEIEIATKIAETFKKLGKPLDESTDRILNRPKYTLEEQQEEAIVELLGLMTAEKLDAVKDGKLISLLKRLLKEMKQFIRSLLNQKEVEIDKLPDNMTLGDLSDLLAYSNSKLILPGYEVEYTTPDNEKFKTYQEASNHISQLAKNVEDVDLDNIKIDLKLADKLEDITVESFSGLMDKDINTTYHKKNNKWFKHVEEILYDEYNEPDFQKPIITEAKTEEILEWYNKQIDKLAYGNVREFIEKNKEYEQSKEIIEEWKKVNNIQYNPEEIYSRGQEFSSVVGAYSSFDVNLMMQNLLSHIEDNEKAGGKFAISAYTKPIDKQIGHLEGGGGKIKFKIYPQSKDILWAANTDVYSGSVWDASEKVNKDKKSELLGVSYTKYPSLNNVNSIQPNLAAIVDDLAHHHNELGISLNFSNFELEVDEDVPYTTKKIIENINKILQQKRNGKLVKPEINKINTIPDTFEYWQQDMNEDGGIDRFRIQVYKKNDKWFEEFFDTYGQSESVREITYNEVEDQFNEALASNSTLTRNKGIQPKITKETLKESIESVKRQNTSIKENQWAVEPYAEEEYAVYTYMGEFVEGQPTFKSLEEANRWLKINQPKEKEYSEQALINTKIARLKEVAKKYPRSLIRSEVVRQIDTASYTGIGNDLFDEEDMPFQKIPSIATKQEENPSETLNLAEQKNHCKL